MAAKSIRELDCANSRVSRRGSLGSSVCDPLLAGLLQSSPHGIVILDHRGRCLHASEAICRLVGKSESELSGLNWMKSVHEEDRRQILAWWNRGKPRGEFASAPLRLMDPTGQGRWHEICGKPMPGSGWAIYCTDIHRERDFFEALQSSRRSLAEVMDAAQIGIWELLLPSMELKLSANYLCQIGLPADTKLRFREWKELVHPSDIVAIQDLYRSHIQERSDYFEHQYRIESADKTAILWARCFAADHNEKGLPTRLVAINMDVTDQVARDVESRASATLLEKIAASTMDLIYVYDLVERRNTYSNRSVGVVLGYSEAEILALGQNLFPTIIHPDDLGRVCEQQEAINDCADDEVIIIDYRVVCRDGETKWLRSRDVILDRDGDGRARRIVGVAQDITDLKQREATMQLSLQSANEARKALGAQKLALESAYHQLSAANSHLTRLSITDSLTGLRNHMSFQEELAAALPRANQLREPLGLLLIDLDHFKRVNDTYGHIVGDEVLREVGTLLADCVRDQDVAARYGGEEFAIILTNTSADESVDAAERIRKRIEGYNFSFGQVTASIGIATTDPAIGIMVQPRDLLVRADIALYASKSNGRNQVTAWDQTLLKAA